MAVIPVESVEVETFPRAFADLPKCNLSQTTNFLENRRGFISGDQERLQILCCNEQPIRRQRCDLSCKQIRTLWRRQGFKSLGAFFVSTRCDSTAFPARENVTP